MKSDTKTETISMNWQGTLPMLLTIYAESTKADDREYAYKELQRMAKLADAYVDLKK